MEKANGCYVSFSGKGCGNEAAETTLNRLLSLNLKQIQDYYCCWTKKFSRNVPRIEFWIRHLSTCTQVVLPSAYIVFALLHIEALFKNKIDSLKQ